MSSGHKKKVKVMQSKVNGCLERNKERIVVINGLI